MPSRRLTSPVRGTDDAMRPCDGGMRRIRHPSVHCIETSSGGKAGMAICCWV